MKYQMQRQSDPDRTEATDADGDWVATLTDGAYTATLLGPSRTFAETTAADAVTHSTWVRTLPAPFEGTVDETWLDCALRANAHGIADVLAISMQYIEGAPPIAAGGLLIAGMADYGPLKGGEREEGSDFNDYLGITWTYPEKVDKPEQRQWRCLDCSGFLRMVWGYRHHLPGAGYPDRVPLCLDPRTDKSAMPRRSFQIYKSAPGVILVQDTKTQVTDFSRLGIGDLVFFDVEGDDGTRIDHIGTYLGIDAGGHHRFISSRWKANGPTLGDFGNKSILDGTGFYASHFRGVRRI